MRTSLPFSIYIGTGLIVTLACTVLAVTPLRAWGPRTHAAIAHLALPELGRHPSTSFLVATPSTCDAFRGGSVAPDMTFDILSGGKTDPEYNALLHNELFLAHLVQRARSDGDQDTRALALGTVAHLAGDRVGNPDSGPVHINSFGWPTDRDILGRPVQDPEKSAAFVLRGVTASLNKILIDGLLTGSLGGHSDAARTRAPELILAILSYDGPGALPHRTPQERGAIESKVRGFVRSFGTSQSVLARVSDRIWNRSSLREALVEVFGGRGGQVGRIDDSVVQVVQDLLGRGGRGDMISSAHHGGCLTDEDPEDQALLSECLAWVGGLAEEPIVSDGRPDSLRDLKRSIFKTFFVQVFIPFRSWDSIRAAVRGRIP